MPSERKSSTLYKGDDIEAVFVAVGRPRPLIVTFQPRTIPGQQEEEFAEQFLFDRGYSAVHILASRNHWYQTREMEPVLASIKQLATGFPGVITYGSSMGAHAALLFAERLGATAMALSPLYSTNPEVVPFEKRYLRDLPYIADFCYPPEMMHGVRGHALYDPMSLDRRHGTLISARTDLQMIAMPFSGHPTGPYLVETGQLSTLFLQAFANHPMRAADRAREHRAKSPTYWRMMSIIARRHRRPLLALRAARRAVRLSPDDPRCNEVLNAALADV